jgi:hypothetical protein
MNINLNINRRLVYRAAAVVALVATLTGISSQTRADIGTCNGASITVPFTDVPAGNIFFCSIASAYFTGLTNGTSPTTYSPAAPVPREQMAAFITRTLDQSLRRGNRRAAAQQWWQTTTASALRRIAAFDGWTNSIAWDGTNLWVADSNGNVTRYRANDYSATPNWIGAINPDEVIVAASYVFITGLQGPGTPGRVYRLDPNESPATVTLFEDNTGPNPTGITFDGDSLWTANNAGGLVGGSITRISLIGIESTFTEGFVAPSDILWHGENLWVADFAADRVKRIDPTTGAVLQSILVGNAPRDLLFDGANLWVSNFSSDSVTVIRAVGSLRGTVLATLTGNGLNAPAGMAFDGERVLVTNYQALGSVSLFKATDLTPLGNVFTGANTYPVAACSDGLNFFIARQTKGDIVRY